MARKSGFEEMVEAASLLPWYISLACALGSYFVLHWLSLQPPPTSPGEMGRIVLIGAASAAQYILPMIFIFGALFSFLHKRRKAEIFDKQTDLQTILQLSWHEFELLISEAYRRQGYSVVEHGGNGPDGGVDLMLAKDGRKTIVQCKRWTAYNVRVQQVRESYGVMVAEHADACIFVTSGRFTKDAQRFAEGKPIKLIDGKELVVLLKDIKTPSLKSPEVKVPETNPACPDCGSEMVRRRAGRGRNRGKEFWGCSKFPNCLGTR